MIRILDYYFNPNCISDINLDPYIVKNCYGDKRPYEGIEIFMSNGNSYKIPDIDCKRKYHATAREYIQKIL